MAAPEAGFLAERLAKASAVPAEQRSADVRAFIETCRLQAELVEELGLPEGVEDAQEWNGFWHRWTAAPALKLVRSHLIAPGAPLVYSSELLLFAAYNVYMRTSYGHTGTLPSDLGQELTELLEGDPSLETFAIIAAGIPGATQDRGWGKGLLKMSNSMVALMRRPAVRRRLQSELAALPYQLVSYEELLAFFIDYGSKKAVSLCWDGNAGTSSEDIRNAALLAAELVPQLAPDNPRLRFAAANTVNCAYEQHSPAAIARSRYLTMRPAALDVARQQGSDFYIAACGFGMASDTPIWVAESAVQQGLPAPSAVLDWLQQAEAAHCRCKALLPRQWTSELDGMKARAGPAKAWLQRMQQQGDRWRQLTPAVQHQVLAVALKEYHDHPEDEASRNRKFTCSGCGQLAPQLRTCGACKEVRYCSVDCQHTHWREHKAHCKEVQAAKAAAAGAASASGSGS